MNRPIASNRERYRFPKAEKLCSKKLINELFKKGNSFRISDIKCQYLLIREPLPSPVQMMVTVPKKTFRRAVDRNLLKRRIREAYRLHKGSLLRIASENNDHLILAFIYLDKNIAAYQSIEESVDRAISTLMKRLK
jgi:ribonuclease P protein component